MSSVYYDTGLGIGYLYSRYANDGIYEIPYPVAHSNYEEDPYWEVDLGSNHCIWGVRILNRYDGEIIL